MSLKTSQNLKSKLNNNELDLSLSELTTVPVKDILSLKKVQSLDLSANKLRSLPDDFGLLTNLVKIDLSGNALTFLPESFGQLTQLQHLDLYKNELTELPLSFGRLKKLQWLDIKDNPLSEDLKVIAGDCLDTKQCKTAATKVVQHLSDLEDRRAKLLKQQKEREAKAKIIAEEAELEKKREEKKKDKDNRRKLNTKAQADHSGSERETRKTPEKSKTMDASAKVDRNSVRAQFVPPKRSKLSLCCQALLTIILTVGILGLFGVFFVPQLCQPPRGSEQQWVYAKIFCDEVYRHVAAVQVHLEGSPLAPYVEKMAEAVIHIGSYWASVMQNVDVKWIVDKLAIWGAEVLEWLDVAKNWFYANGWDYVKNFGSICSMVATVIYNVGYDVVIWIADFCTHVINNWPEVWEKVKFYWANLK